MKKKFVGLFALLAVGLLLTGGIVSAFGPNGFANDDEMRRAIDDGDFQTWKYLHEERLTESEFALVQERHQNRAEGHSGMMLGREDLRDAIENNDYQAYTESVLEIFPEASVMSESDFATLVEMHQARLDGDMDTWNALREEVDFAPREMMGFVQGSFRGQGRGHGMGQGAGMGEGLHYGDCPLE